LAASSLCRRGRRSTKLSYGPILAIHSILLKLQNQFAFRFFRNLGATWSNGWFFTPEHLNTVRARQFFLHGTHQQSQNAIASKAAGEMEMSGSSQMRISSSCPEFKLTSTAFERSRWRGGRFGCYAPHVMPQGRAFNCDFSLFSDFPKPCKINKLQTKKDSIPIAIRSGPAISPHPPQPPAATFNAEHF